MKTVLSLVLFSLVLLICGRYGQAEEMRSPQMITEEMLPDYGNNKEKANDRIAERLEELAAVDVNLASRWKAIMELWDQEQKQSAD